VDEGPAGRARLATSLLNPLWYAGSFAIGVAAGMAGDAVNLGFVVETERQVEEHLTGHMDRLPPQDARSRAIVEQMRDDEARHGALALAAGGTPLPFPVRGLMRMAADVMRRWRIACRGQGCERERALACHGAQSAGQQVPEGAVWARSPFRSHPSPAFAHSRSARNLATRNACAIASPPA